VHFRGNAPLAFGRIVLCHVLPLQVGGYPKGQGERSSDVNSGYFAGYIAHLQWAGLAADFSFKFSPDVDLNARTRLYTNVGYLKCGWLQSGRSMIDRNGCAE